MKTTLIAASLLGLMACDLTTGEFKSPGDMTALEKCENARMLLTLAEINEVGDDLLNRARLNVEALCPSAL